jgi:predicted transcriptional regulator
LKSILQPGCRAQVLIALKKAGPNGLTREEIARDLQKPIQAVTQSVSELILLRQAREPLGTRKTTTGRAAKVVVAVF